jgi:hypothetical protein
MAAARLFVDAPEPDITPIVGAARIVADPDAATERILDRMGMHEHTQHDWDRAYEFALAALDITLIRRADR